MKYALPTIPSPCVKICEMDRQTGLCRGCWRSIEEIALWSNLGDDARAAVLERIETRRVEHPRRRRLRRGGSVAGG